MDSNFPGNSNRARETPEAAEPQKEREKVERVVGGKVVRRKKPLGTRFAEMFLKGEDSRSVMQYVVQDVLIPAFRDMVTDAITEGIHRRMYGDSRPSGSRRPSQRGGSTPYTPYNRYSTQAPRREETRTISRRARSQHDFDEIILSNRTEAEEVLDQLGNLIDQYGTASVMDLYDLVGITANFTDSNWGWRTLQRADISRVRNGGYLLNLPEPEQIDK